MNSELFAQLEFLRAHVESVVERSSVIMITSAKPGDGKSLAAHGIAERLADTGLRVVLISFAPLDADAKDANGRERLRSYPIVTLPYEDESSPIATQALRAKIEDLRTKFEYTIIDGAPLLRSRIATLLASMVDAILVTVRLGRSSDRDDTALVDSLHRTDSSVLGVVAVSAKDIVEFASRARTRHPGDVTPQMLKPTPSFPEFDRATRPAFEGSRR